MIKNQATRIFSSTLGILVGLAGVEHGILEILQGNIKPDGILVNAIGPEQKLWEFASETVLTIIPNMLFSGILSLLLGILVIIWAYGYIGKKYGAGIFLFLSSGLFLVGGGFAPIFLTILAFVAATRLDKPQKFWRLKIPASLQNPIARLWPWSLIAAIISFLIAVEIAIFGQPLSSLLSPEKAYTIQFFLGLAMLIFSIAALPAASAHDAKRLADPY